MIDIKYLVRSNDLEGLKIMFKNSNSIFSDVMITINNAIVCDNIDIVMYIYENFPYPHRDTNTYIRQAISYNSMLTLKYILKTHKKYTTYRCIEHCFSVAARFGWLEIVKLLLKNYNIKTYDIETAVIVTDNMFYFELSNILSLVLYIRENYKCKNNKYITFIF